MSTFRLISLPTHSVFELLAGLALMGLPFAMGFGGAGLVVSFLLGTLLVGIALGSAENLPVSAHLALDRLVGAGIVFAALAIGLTGDRTASAVLLGAAVSHFALSASTRYTSAGYTPRL